jgi:hypothetical protein
VNALPREARDGLMRAWLKVLGDRHPGVTWLPVEATGDTPDPGKEVNTTVSE